MYVNVLMGLTYIPHVAMESFPLLQTDEKPPFLPKIQGNGAL